MVVRIRFRRGPRVERRKGKNSRAAWLAASLLTLGSVSCLVLGLWRLGVDFGWAAAFVFPDTSFFSHWQIWLSAALAIQVAAWRLNRYGKPKEQGLPEAREAAGSGKKKKEAAANA
jgi:hypothetical protein